MLNLKQNLNIIKEELLSKNIKVMDLNQFKNEDKLENYFLTLKNYMFDN